MTRGFLSLLDTPEKGLRRPARLVIVLPHLGIGGAQRVAVTLAKHWAEHGLDVHLVTRLEETEDFYQLSPLIKRHCLRKVLRTAGPESESLLGGVATNALRNLQSHLIRQLRSAYVSYSRYLKLHTKHKLADALRCFAGSRILTFAPVLYLALMRATLWQVPALRQLLRVLEPDVVVSFLGATNIITIASARGLPARVVISERNDPVRQELELAWQILRPVIYRMADAVTANSHGALAEMRDYCPAAKLGYAPNPVVFNSAGRCKRVNAVLFLARLVPQKGPDVLIEAFTKFVQENPDWTLQMAGAGPMERELIARVRDYGLEDRVVFHGLVKDPTDLLLRSRVFVLPSRFEGTPNSLLEAMAARLACVVTDASPGPLRLIEHGVSGLVVKTDDAEDLAAALHQLAQNAALRRKVARAAWRRVGPFHLDAVAHAWDRILFPERL